MKKECIVISGPTAVGKTSLSLKLAERISGSIISADCIQVYRGLDVGSSKLPEKDRRGIPHYLIDVLDPREDFDVTRFCAMAREAMGDIYEKQRLPIIVGGTGFYIQALLKGVDFNEDAPGGGIREELRGYAREHGNHALHEMLCAIDPDSADAIHENNVKRVVRAIEFYRLTGERISCHNKKESENVPDYTYAYFAVTDDRQVLYERINRRVDEMMEEGLLSEVRALFDSGLTSRNISMKGIGYSELILYLEGKLSLEEAVEKIKTDTRHYAKRQLTWLRREKDVIWLNRPDYGGDEDAMTDAMIQKWEMIRNENA